MTKVLIDHGAPPSIPLSELPYQSYTEDPKWQMRFTAMWLSALGACVVLALIHGSLRLPNIRDAFKGFLGIRVRGLYETVPCCLDGDFPEKRPVIESRPTPIFVRIGRTIGGLRLWSAPGIPLNVGQMFVIAGYAAFVMTCIVIRVPLQENPNRAGFIALASLPPVFLFAAKNSPLTNLLLGPGVDYTKLNYIHRWAGRFLFIGALVHGSLWIRNHVAYGLPILAQQKESSGIAAFGVLGIIMISTIAPLRRYSYSAFLVIHYLTFPAFFVTICYHTIYARPWIFPPLAFYGADLLLRFLRWRVVVGRVEAKGQGSAAMSLIHVPLAANGWKAGQHVQVRAMFGGRAWESHPLSICCAVPGESCLTTPDGAPIGMLLAARACGDWSRSLHSWAQNPDSIFVNGEQQSSTTEDNAQRVDDELTGRDAHLILEGPYGGPTLNPDDFESVLMFAGGSGATFTLGVLDALVARSVPLGNPTDAQPKTTRVVWCWCVRSFGAINWFAPYLLQIARRAAHKSSPLDLRIRIFVTCLCDPDAVPRIPGCTVTEARPSVKDVLATLLDVNVVDEFDCCSPVAGDGASENLSTDDLKGASMARTTKTPATNALDSEKGVGGDSTRHQPHGGVAVFAAGPGGLIREAGNAVASANLSAVGMRAGGVSFCAEAFTV
ncbi:Iron reductase [Mycena indigotica]|uniref:Iron reductase n=1 Tax=Mycena indigotica TaxID=2126181 RepID=A0A8H6SHR9_9AGAR|nr:Iron reductase [Mycena indigotica]KAF7299025.1 Iron reductase [Mycena indigotica]